MMRLWLRSPVVHFVLIGGLLFAVRASWRTLDGMPTRRVERPPIVLSAQRVRQLQADFVQRWGTKPTGDQLQALIQQALDDELLYREARVLQLDFRGCQIPFPSGIGFMPIPRAGLPATAATVSRLRSSSSNLRLGPVRLPPCSGCISSGCTSRSPSACRRSPRSGSRSPMPC
jgi:hypothetical protein